MVVWIYHSKRLLTLKYALWKATVISYLIQSLGAGDGTGPGWLLRGKCHFKFPFFLSEPFPEYQYKTSSGPITCHSWQDNGKTWPFFMEFWPIFDIFHRLQPYLCSKRDDLGSHKQATHRRRGDEPFLLHLGPPFMTGDGPKTVHFGQKMAKHGRLVNAPKWSKRVQKRPKWST